jgi:hypothetical protein
MVLRNVIENELLIITVLSSVGELTFRTMILGQRPLRTVYVYDIQSLFSTLLDAGTILWCPKNLLPFDDFHFPLHKKQVPPLSHLTSCVSIKCNLHLVISQDTAVSEPEIYRLHIPCTKSHSRFPLFRSYMYPFPNKTSYG